MKLLRRTLAGILIVAAVAFSIIGHVLETDRGDGVPRDGFGRQAYPKDMIFSAELFMHPAALGWTFFDLLVLGSLFGAAGWLLKKEEKPE